MGALKRIRLFRASPVDDRVLARSGRPLVAVDGSASAKLIRSLSNDVVLVGDDGLGGVLALDARGEARGVSEKDVSRRVGGRGAAADGAPASGVAATVDKAVWDDVRWNIDVSRFTVDRRTGGLGLVVDSDNCTGTSAGTSRCAVDVRVGGVGRVSTINGFGVVSCCW